MHIVSEGFMRNASALEFVAVFKYLIKCKLLNGVSHIIGERCSVFVLQLTETSFHDVLFLLVKEWLTESENWRN